MTPAHVLGSFFAFRALYYLLRARARALSPAALSRLVSCVHACTLAALGALGIVAPGLRGAPEWRAAVCAVPLGYLAHDVGLIWGEPALWEPSMLAHHLAFAVLVLVGTEKYPELAARAHLAEISTPLLHAAWAARRSGADRRHPRAAAGLGVALLATFFYFRVYALGALTLEAYAQGERVAGVLVLGLTGLNWYWFALLLRRAARALAGEPPPRPEAPGKRRRLRKI